jgi:predicted GNAT family acetyltransferase
MQDNRDRGRFEMEEGGLLVFANYRVQGDVLAITHVEAAPPLRGTGAADRLMRAIVEHARGAGLRIRPYCGYAAAWLRRHKEFADLVG